MSAVAVTISQDPAAMQVAEAAASAIAHAIHAHDRFAMLGEWMLWADEQTYTLTVPLAAGVHELLLLHALPLHLAGQHVSDPMALLRVCVCRRLQLDPSTTRVWTERDVSNGRYHIHATYAVGGNNAD